MGFVDFTSHRVEIASSAGSVYDFLNDMNNFRTMMPDQVVNWQSTNEECEFDIKGMAHIGLVKSEAIEGKSVEVVSKPDNPLEIKLKANIETTGTDSSAVILELSANLSPILKMMASAPLQNLVNIMAERLRGVLSSEF